MAIYPSNWTGQDVLQPGARGEQFVNNMPGHRNNDPRINRTQNNLKTSAHDVLNQKYAFDKRLPALFRYGYAYGFNQIVIPKGRIVSIDPFMSQVDFETNKSFNAITIANGGKDVDIIPTTSGSDIRNNWKEAGTAFDLDIETGLDKNDSTKRPANTPIGVLMRNEYTRDVDAFNGIMPGAIMTDCVIELPMFASALGANSNPWGSAYNLTTSVDADALKAGIEVLRPGTLVKSDTNGRFIPSPLNDPEKSKLDTVAKYEAEKKQLVGKVISVAKDLVPEGAARYAQWAISDLENFQDFNPGELRQNGRTGEDVVSNSPFKSTGKYPGYPYEKGYKANDLNMIMSRQPYNQRMNMEHRHDYGIPGLTDGANVVKGNFGADLTKTFEGTATDAVNFKLAPNEGTMPKATATQLKGYRQIMRALDTNAQGLAIGFSGVGKTPDPINLGTIKIGDKIGGGDWGSATGVADFLTVDYIDFKQGLVGITIVDDADAAEAVKALTDLLAGDVMSFNIGSISNGLTGVPTFLDWEGVIGSIKILLTM